MNTQRICIALLGLALAAALSATQAAGEKVGVISITPTIAPGGSIIAFSADFEEKFRIWVSDLAGRQLKRVSSTLSTNEEIAHSEPTWSPDGKYIAYVSESSGSSDIWIMQADGGHPIRLTTGGANSQPAWSPDGARIAFVSDRGGTKDIWLMNVDGAQQTRLTSSLGQENNPQFSPSGDRLVYSETSGDTASLRIINRDGSSGRPVTSSGFNDWEPNWGAQGIVFSSNRDRSGRWKIWVVQPDGSGLRMLGDIAGHDPRWMPDGRVLFTDEPVGSRALATVSLFDPQRGTKHVIVDVQGYAVSIDIRPNKAENRLNPRSRGKVEVAVLSTPSLDATKTVDLRSPTFGRTGSEPSLSSCGRPNRDVNRDGFVDLVCRFHTAVAGFNDGSTVGVLRFLDTRGRPYEGRDTIKVVPSEDPDDFKD